MSPEYITGNLWELFDGETVEGVGGAIRGPAVVRVHEFSEQGKFLVQSGPVWVEIKASSFEEAVKNAPDL